MRANRRASGPLLQSVFLAVLDHCADNQKRLTNSASYQKSAYHSKCSRFTLPRERKTFHSADTVQVKQKDEKGDSEANFTWVNDWKLRMEDDFLC